MGRLRRFAEFRFVGVRDTMIVYDCDQDEQYALLAERVESDNLVAKNLLSTFAPDELPEARNRGFREWELERSR
ncbi:MAG: hypothetical protein ACXW15_08760 [Acidimicrobiia bacterium]